LTVTEPETSGPSTTKPTIETLVTFEDTIQAEDAYVAAVGRVAYAWNRLHEQLGVLFVAVSGMERKVALTKWYSVRNDRAQREMLKAAVFATSSQRSEKLPDAPDDDLIWLLESADDLAEDRNNAVHAPCSLFISESGSEMVAAFFDGNPRAKNLMGKRLLVEFAWCEKCAETLISFTERLGVAIAFPERFPWPQRPKILSREDCSGESRGS
jgi:hypothetical protein